MPETRGECPCPRTGCERRGLCAPCREYHARKRSPPYCERGGRRERRREGPQEKNAGGRKTADPKEAASGGPRQTPGR